MSSTENRALLRPLAFVLVRMLLTSYFVALSVDLIAFPPGKAFVAEIMPANLAAPAYTMFLFGTALLILLDQHTRAATLLLSIFILSAAFHAYVLPEQGKDFAAFWKELTLVAALILCYAETDPRHRRRNGLIRFSRRIRPRRIVIQAAPMPRRQRELPNPSARLFSGKADIDDALEENLFATAFDEAPSGG